MKWFHDLPSIKGRGLGGCKFVSKRLQAAEYPAHEAFSSLVELEEVRKEAESEAVTNEKDSLLDYPFRQSIQTSPRLFLQSISF